MKRALSRMIGLMIMTVYVIMIVLIVVRMRMSTIVVIVRGRSTVMHMRMGWRMNSQCAKQAALQQTEADACHHYPRD